MNIKVLLFFGMAMLPGLVPAGADEAVFPSPNLQKVKTAPKKYSEAADIVVESVETAQNCDPDKICVEGMLHNQGKKTAYHMKLLVEIGGSKYGKPRTSFYEKLEDTTMDPEDRQDFAFMIDRKIPYKVKGEKKEIEVGKYNFKVIPTWSNEDVIVHSRTSRKK